VVNTCYEENIKEGVGDGEEDADWRGICIKKSTPSARTTPSRIERRWKIS
jgi:hypothetical protein